MSEYIIDMSNSIYTSQDNLIHFDFSNIHEEIVRCRDCAHAIDNGEKGNADYCGRPDGDGGYLLFSVEPDGFCKWGERRQL